MAKFSKTSVFKAYRSRSETPMEKTTRIAREMVDEEAERRQVKIVRLRKARLEREAHTPTKSVKKK